MNITKYSITIDTTSNNSSTGGYFYSNGWPNGMVHAVEYVGATASAVPSTAVLDLFAGSTVLTILSRSVTSTGWIVFPRHSIIDSTNAQIGATTDYPAVPCALAGDVKLTLGLTGGTSAATTGLVNVYVEGV